MNAQILHIHNDIINNEIMKIGIFIFKTIN